MATVWGKATEMPFLETPFMDFLQVPVAAFGKVGIGAGASGNRMLKQGNHQDPCRAWSLGLR